MMNLRRPLAVLLAGALSGCLLPASVFERASFPNVDPVERPDYWQEQGRYRQEPAAGDPSRTTTVAPTSAAPAGTVAPQPGAPLAAADPSMHTAAQATPGASQPQRGSMQPLSAPASQQQPLLGWDGGVVDGATQGSVAQEGEPVRGLEPSATGRMHIIELYQRVLDERDALTAEVDSVNRSLDETNAALAAERTKSADLEVRLAALEESHRRSMEENRELAARLATSQIRRLEAEKLLLETRLEEARARAAAEAAPADGKPLERRNPAKPAEPKEQG